MRFQALLDRLRSIAAVIWAGAYSPLAIALVSGLLLTSIAQNYASRDAAVKDKAERRRVLALSLAELQQRVASLQSADRLWSGRCDYARSSTQEWEVINASGAYIPTSPAYKNVHLNVVINDVEGSTGVPDMMFGSLLALGVFSVPPPRTALFVRGQLDWLRKYGSSRSFLLATEQLPLATGQVADNFTNSILEIPGSTPELRERLHREALEAHEAIQAALARAANDTRPPCPEPRRLR